MKKETENNSSETWVEAWENNDLTFVDVKEEHRKAWLNETFEWLYSGRRWPMQPTKYAMEICEKRYQRIGKLMTDHGWCLGGKEITIKLPNEKGELQEYQQFVAKWFFYADQTKHVSYASHHTAYAVVIAAILCRRKARKYGLWIEDENWDPNHIGKKSDEVVPREWNMFLNYPELNKH